MQINVTRVSPLSKIENTITVEVTQEEIEKYNTGDYLLQDCFPNLTGAEREFIKTGYTDADWDAMFPEPIGGVNGLSTEALVAICEDAGVTLVEAEEEEIRGRWDWLDKDGNASDSSLETQREAALDAITILDLVEE